MDNLSGSQKKFIVVLIDGASDYPIEKIGNVTPLKAACKPNMDFLASHGFLGLVKTIPDGMSPGSDTANLSILGYDPLKYSTGRSSLEAVSIGVNLEDEDITYRCNLVTLSKEENFEDRRLIDYSAGEISTEEAKILIDYLSKNLNNEFLNFYAGVSYRHVIVFKNVNIKNINNIIVNNVNNKSINNVFLNNFLEKKIIERIYKENVTSKNIDIDFDNVINELISNLKVSNVSYFGISDDTKDIILTPPHDISGKIIKNYLPKIADTDFSKLKLNLKLKLNNLSAKNVKNAATEFIEDEYFNPEINDLRSDKIFISELKKISEIHILTNLMKKASELLKNHPINLERKKKAKNPANAIWIWAKAKKPKIDSFYKKYKKKGAVISAVDLIKGIGICAGLEAVNVTGATGNINTNFEGKAAAAINQLKSGKDFVYIHIEAPDECSHQGNINCKIKAIELIDEKIIGKLKADLDLFGFNYRIMVLPDHPTPISLKTHTSEPVPFLIYDKDSSNFKKRIKKFLEFKESLNNNFNINDYNMDKDIENNKGIKDNEDSKYSKCDKDIKDNIDRTYVTYDEITAKKSGIFINQGYKLMDLFLLEF